jgi:solute:Na+ symporter, SSS family
VLTTADLFERRFGREMMYLYSLFALVVLISFNGLMLFGSGKLVEALTGHAIGWRTAVVAMAVIAFFYGVAGGLIAAVWNDFFQGILTIVMSLLILPFFWSRIGGLEGFRAAVSGSNHPNVDHVFDLVLGKDMTVFWIAMVSVSSLVSMVAQPQIMASTAAGRSEMDSRVGFVGGMILKRLMTIPWALTGVMAIALLGYSSSTSPDHAFGLMAAELLPAGCVGLMLACVMASVMDNCAVNMLSFAGIYTNSVHGRLIAPAADERALLRVSRWSSIVFAIVSLGLSFLFTDIPGAMRFMWQFVPLMGIPWFLMILWRRTNRWGAIASFVAAGGATVIANFALGWNGDAGLPYTVLLYICSGFGAGVVVSLLTPPEPRERTELFFLLLKTPVGQEHILRDAGFREMPGNDTYEMPEPERTDAPDARLSRDDEADGGIAVEVERPATARLSVAAALRRIDNRKARRQSIYGVVIMTLVVLAFVAAVNLFAAWLAP